MVKAVIFDFGGVLAEEGFREGLKVVAIKNGLDPEEFFKIAEEMIYKTGYLTGMTDEKIIGMPSGKRQALKAAIKN